ncbi:hypothetical protein PHISCL_03298 [Aspergillus sclerotialis]|uniref:Integral membrane protein n=1 Tax=Aspergillus sclerotialis TaxID=2070753 RepID=A0A3A2ZNZ1_9EURO|nr:hypothetical protein PHISCL_03298 [Aspergillus sclerotialis]
MDGFDASQAPAEYHEVAWIADILVVGMAVGWVTNYIAMALKSFRDCTYCMPIIVLCSNMAWDLVFSLLHRSNNNFEKVAFVCGAVANVGVIYAAAKYGANEWIHSPFVMRNLPLIFALGIVGCVTGYLAIAEQIGPELAISWGAAFAQLLISTGTLCQLLSRGSTRGTSLSRSLGTGCGTAFALIRYVYWPEAFSFVAEPLLMFWIVVFSLADCFYGICFYYVRKYERAQSTKVNGKNI